jgi:gluconolactonase
MNWTPIAGDVVSPEGPAARADGALALVSRWTGRVLLVSPGGPVEEIVQTGGKPQSVAWTGAGRLLLADARNRALQEIDTASRTIRSVSDTVGGEPFLGPNDLAIGADGIVYLTDPGLSLDAPGRILRIDPATGHASVLASGLSFPNGITISDDGRWLVVAESFAHRILRFELRDGGRSLGPPDTLHRFVDHLPDGIAYDSAGNLLVALFGGGTIEVVAPNGQISASIDTGGRHPTNCVFGGPDFRTLFVTEDDRMTVLSASWPVPGQRRFSRSWVGARATTPPDRGGA